jgi:transcription elongation factor/antiterminator RfaH
MGGSIASRPVRDLSSWVPLSGGERWYVVRTLAQRERHAAQQLANQNYCAFLPLHLKNRRHARRVETILTPLFPRYLFVILDRTRDRWRSINGTLGVERLLMCGGEPQPVPEGVVENLMLAADQDGTVHFDYALHQGQMIKVTAGPFADFVGWLERVDDKGRVSVLLELLGGSVPVALKRSLLVPHEDGA